MNDKIKRLEKDHIVQLLPHKYPFVMVDRVLDYKKGEWIKGIKHIELNPRIRVENHHMMLCESLAQLSKLLDILSSDKKKISISYLTSVKVDFFNNVTIGDDIELFAKLISNYKEMCCFEVNANVNSIPVLSGSIYRRIQAPKF